MGRHVGSGGARHTGRPGRAPWPRPGSLPTLDSCPASSPATRARNATALTGLALLAGLPLGVAVGRWAWALFSDSLGVPPGALVPVSFVLLMVPAALLVANAVAFWPARTAAGLRPAPVLRAE